MTRAPKNSTIPTLVDSDHVKEIFATDVVGAGVISGCISLNLAVHRWSVTQAGKDPEIHRALVARLVLSKEAAMQLAQSLANLSKSSAKVKSEEPASPDNK